jgi:hypothetical protein
MNTVAALFNAARVSLLIWIDGGSTFLTRRATEVVGSSNSANPPELLDGAAGAESAFEDETGAALLLDVIEDMFSQANR